MDYDEFEYDEKDYVDDIFDQYGTVDASLLVELYDHEWEPDDMYNDDIED